MSSKLLQKYNKMPAPVKASLWFTICNVLQKGIALITTPIFTRIMTTDQYGQYSVYQSWYTIVAIFATFNLYAGVYNNGMVKWPNDRKKYTSTLQGLSTSLTVILFVVYLCAMTFWNNLLKMSSVFMFAMFAELLFAPAYNFWAAGQRFDYKYRKLVLVTIVLALASPIIGVISVKSTEYKAEARVLSFVFVQVCIGLIFYIYNMVQGRRFYSKKYWKFALGFTLPLIPHYLSQVVLGQADRIMIQRMVGNSEAALYSVAYTISMMFNIVTTAVNNSFIPYTYKSINDKKYKSLSGNASFLVTCVAVGCIFATAFGPEIIRIFASPEYYDAHRVVPPVAISLLFVFITSLFANVEFYYEETKFIMVASSVAAITNIIMNYFGIIWFGYIAAAYTTLICYILLALAHYIAHKRILEKRMEHGQDIKTEIYDSKYLLAVSGTTIVSMFGMLLIYEQMIIRYSVIVIILVAIFIKRKMIIEKFKEIRKK